MNNMDLNQVVQSGFIEFDFDLILYFPLTIFQL